MFFNVKLKKLKKKAVVETQSQKQLCKTETEKFNYRLAKCWHSMLKNDVLRFGAETCFSFGGYDIAPKDMKPPGHQAHEVTAHATLFPWKHPGPSGVAAQLHRIFASSSMVKMASYKFFKIMPMDSALKHHLWKVCLAEFKLLCHS